MGRRSKKSLRGLRLCHLRMLKRRQAQERSSEGVTDDGPDDEDEVAMETPPSPDADEEWQPGEGQADLIEDSSTQSGSIASRVRNKKRMNLDKVVEAMKKRKTNGNPRQQDPGPLNDEQLGNIGAFLNKQTSVIQQHMQQNDIESPTSKNQNTDTVNSQTDQPSSLQIYNEMKKLYGANLKYFLVRDTLLPERMTSTRALSSLPWQLLVGQSEACGGNLGVFSKVYLKANSVFEPMTAPTIEPEDVTKDMNTKYIWPLFDDGKISRYIDVSDEKSSSWLRYMNPAPKLAMQNVEVRLVQDTIFFVTVRHIKPGTELLFWLSHPYCKMQYLPYDPERLPMRFDCDKCQLEFETPVCAHRHVTIFHPYGLKKEKYTCYMCKEVVYGRKKLTQHMQDEHGTKAAWQCEECGKAVHSRSYLKEHKRKVHLPEEKAKTHPCEECGRMFKCRAHLKRHVECIHVRNFNLECEYCNKKFSLQKYLDKHLKAHKGDFPFVCDKCSKGFFDSHSLKVHLLTHSGVRPYKCTLCDTATSTKQLLQFHFKKSHGFTADNMPDIKRRVELTFDSSPVIGYRERDKPPRQRIFRTRPVDKPETAARDALEDSSCDVEDVGADDLLRGCNHGGGLSEGVTESNTTSNIPDDQASGNVPCVTGPFTSSASGNARDTPCDTEQAGPATCREPSTQTHTLTALVTPAATSPDAEPPVRAVFTNGRDDSTVPDQVDQQNATQRRTALPPTQQTPVQPPPSNYNLLASDFYGQAVGSYADDGQVEQHHGYPTLPVQNSVAPYQPTYSAAAVPIAYPNGPQLAPHTLPPSNYIISQPPWQ